MWKVLEALDRDQDKDEDEEEGEKERGSKGRCLGRGKGCVESLEAEGRRVFGGVVAERRGKGVEGSEDVKQEEGESDEVRRKSDVLSGDLNFR